MVWFVWVGRDGTKWKLWLTIRSCLFNGHTRRGKETKKTLLILKISSSSSRIMESVRLLYCYIYNLYFPRIVICIFLGLYSLAYIRPPLVLVIYSF